SLDRLKCQIHELTITINGTGAPEIPGQVIARRQRGKQWQLVVRSEEDIDFNSLTAQADVLAVESRTPSLEEIFVAYMQSEKRSSAQDLSNAQGLPSLGVGRE